MGRHSGRGPPRNNPAAVFVFNPHPRICSLILEIEEGGERDIDWLRPIRTLTGDRTCDLGV